MAAAKWNKEKFQLKLFQRLKMTFLLFDLSFKYVSALAD